MNIEPSGQLRQGLSAFDRGQCLLGLKCRRMIAAGSFRDDPSPFQAIPSLVVDGVPTYPVVSRSGASSTLLAFLVRKVFSSSWPACSTGAMHARSCLCGTCRGTPRTSQVGSATTSHRSWHAGAGAPKQAPLACQPVEQGDRYSFCNCLLRHKFGYRHAPMVVATFWIFCEFHQ
jgi:hypothetical protein